MIVHVKYNSSMIVSLSCENVSHVCQKQRAIDRVSYITFWKSQWISQKLKNFTRANPRSTPSTLIKLLLAIAWLLPDVASLASHSIFFYFLVSSLLAKSMLLVCYSTNAGES